MAERPEDLNLPSAVVCRIVKDALPPNTKVTKEAQAAIAKAASVFVLYATSCSNSIAGKANRKTIQGQDVVAAMEDMEFDKFIKPLETSLQVWRQSQEKKKNAAKKNAEEKTDNDNSSNKNKNDGSNTNVANKGQTGEKGESRDENKENEDEDSDDIQEIPIS